jgi:hypothetical protein
MSPPDRTEERIPMKRTRLATLLVTAVCCSTLGQAVFVDAAGAAPGESRRGWEPYRTAPFRLAGGTRCPFGLVGTPVRDRERIRTLADFPDGRPKVQQVAGPLVVRYTNVDSGASVRRDLTGRTTISYGGDGSFTETLDHGSLAVGLAATDPGGPGFFVLSGTGFRLHVSAEGGRTVSLGTGRVENLCTTLAAPHPRAR